MVEQDDNKMKGIEDKKRKRSPFIPSIIGYEIFKILAQKKAERENSCEKKAKIKLVRETKKTCNKKSA